MSVFFRALLVALPVLVLAACPSRQAGGEATTSAPSALRNGGGEAGEDRPLTSENYAEEMARRSREYAQLEYKPVSLSAFRCDDQCYVEFIGGVEGAGEEEVPCTASACEAWRAAGVLPDDMRRRYVEAKFGKVTLPAGANNAAGKPVRAIVGFRFSAGTTTRSAEAGSGGTGPLPLRRGVYVRAGTGCGSPPNAAIRIYNGAGLSGSATRDCRATISSQDGNRYRVDQSCENTYDGKRTSELQSISVPDDQSFSMDGASFERCADGTAPAELEKLSR